MLSNISKISGNAKRLNGTRCNGGDGSKRIAANDP
jgi:hypothetical protein